MGSRKPGGEDPNNPPTVSHRKIPGTRTTGWCTQDTVHRLHQGAKWEDGGYCHTAVPFVLYTVDNGLRSRTVLHQLLLILIRICSRSVHPIQCKMLWSENMWSGNGAGGWNEYLSEMIRINENKNKKWSKIAWRGYWSGSWVAME